MIAVSLVMTFPFCLVNEERVVSLEIYFLLLFWGIVKFLLFFYPVAHKRVSPFPWFPRSIIFRDSLLLCAFVSMYACLYWPSYVLQKHWQVVLSLGRMLQSWREYETCQWPGLTPSSWWSWPGHGVLESNSGDANVSLGSDHCPRHLPIINRASALLP